MFTPFAFHSFITIDCVQHLNYFKLSLCRYSKRLSPCEIEVLGVVNIKNIKYLLHDLTGCCYHFPYMIMAEQKNEWSHCNMKQLKRNFTIGELIPVIIVSKNLIARRPSTNLVIWSCWQNIRTLTVLTLSGRTLWQIYSLVEVCLPSAIWSSTDYKSITSKSN
jgi:hypothetical protein